MPSDTAREFVQRLGRDLACGEFDLPPFPDTALRLQQAVNDPDVSVQKIGSIVATEPALAARLMRMANSAMMRRGPIEVVDIDTAISRIGLSMVQTVAVSFAAKDAFPIGRGAAASMLDDLRQHCARVAATAYLLGRKLRFDGKPEEAMLAGLLSSVGKYYIIMRSGDFPQLFADDRALAALLSQWHTGVARAIIESWGFPEHIAEAVDEIEVLERDTSQFGDLGDILLLASLIAAAWPDDAELACLQGLDSLTRLEVEAQTIAAVLETNREELQSLLDVMGG